jgi:FtsH-binding integral membrane protein
MLDVPGISKSESSISSDIDQGLRSYMISIYNYMMLGLAVTGLISWAAFILADVHFSGGHIISASQFGQAIYFSALRWVIVFSPLIMIFYIAAKINTMSVATARMVFLIFSGLIGLSMSSLLVVYTEVSIGRVFFETAAAFGALSFYGYTTKRSLSSMGSFMMMGLFGLIIVMIVNLFLQSTGLQWALSIIGILIFAGLTAWDTQSLKEGYYVGDTSEVSQKKAIFGALQLYLDFINMFQFLLMLTGNRRD